MDRRVFIQRFGRGSLLAAIAALTGVLVTRRQVETGGECTEGKRCRQCISLSDCQLPEAINTRKDGKEG